MKRFFSKLGRFFWSWGFLKFILWTATLIIFFYVEEDWRGARAWATTKAEWEAKGETFDYNKFIPPPIPDDQNLGAIPLFKLEPYSQTDKSLHPATLEKVLRGSLSDNLPRVGNWQKGESPDMEQIRQTVSTAYAAAFKGVEPPKSVLAQYEALYPFLTDLRAAAAIRPFCRFNLDYASYANFPTSRPLGLVTAQLKLSRILTLHAILALDDHQPDLALADLKTIHKLISGVERDPSIIAGLVALGMNSISENAICDGLALHVWNDAQLAEIHDSLDPINFLADHQLEMRCEVPTIIGTIDYCKNKRAVLAGILGTNEGPNQSIRLYTFWPGGWLDQNKSRIVNAHYNEIKSVDAETYRVFPEIANDRERQLRQTLVRLDAYAPWNIIFTVAVPPLASMVQQFAQGQIRIDETRLVCGLERYHLAHGVYPDSLDALFPAYISRLPHDVINGESYHYRLRPDGAFLLYSIGWNQKDDGGKVVYNKDGSNKIDPKEGDWVWPMPKVGAGKSL